MPNDLAKKILSLIDLTSLSENDTDDKIINLCKKADTTFGNVAAVCIYPEFIKIAKDYLQISPVKIATVANFPHGNDALDNVLTAIKKSIEQGAQEIDVVLPYLRYLAGEKDVVSHFVAECKKTCGENILLKVILETGALNNSEVIANASRDVLLAGADFIKTSTGKIPIGATTEAATTMLQVIKELTPQLKRPLGFKASGGVRTIEQASEYLALANNIMGSTWITPNTFRLGASQLLEEVVKICSSLN